MMNVVAVTSGTSMRVLLLALLLGLLTGCSLSDTDTEPNIFYKPVEGDLKTRPSAFSSLTEDELGTIWGQELYIGQQFARELDLYRAITAFKRAGYILPENQEQRRLQIEYSIVLSYFLAGKCNEVLQVFEESTLNKANPENFPPFRELLVIVQSCYDRLGESDKAEKVLQIIEHNDPALAQKLKINTALRVGDTASAITIAAGNKPLLDFVEDYESRVKSPRLAQLFNALLPGAGYFYVGQHGAAVTSFVLNLLFIAATLAFFMRGNWAVALIFFSLELGWYIGGINGAGLAAKEWNEQIYNTLGNGMMTRNDLHPFLMLETTY